MKLDLPIPIPGDIPGHAMDRRQFLSSLVAISSGAGAAALLRPATLWAASHKSLESHESLDPVDPHIRYGITGSLWGEWPNGNLKMSTDLHEIVSDAARFGLQGVEPYSSQVVQFLGQPLALKQICNAAGITLVDVGDLPLARRSPVSGAATAHPETAAGQPNPRPNPWIDKDGNAQLISDMVSFARDFLAPSGCDHWKTNMGSRPEGGPSEDQLKRLATTLNEVGRQTIALGVRLAPHPHIWGPMEREHEVRTVLALTDPKYVWLTPDTAHLTLGGMDAVKIIGDYFPRIAEVHLKDTHPRYRGNKATPTRTEHYQARLYHNLGAGGVDFPAIFGILRERSFRGWVVLDLDAPRPGDGTGSIQQNLAANIEYLRAKVGLGFPKAAA